MKSDLGGSCHRCFSYYISNAGRVEVKLKLVCSTF